MKKIGLCGIYFPGAYDTLFENVPQGFELIDVTDKKDYAKLKDCEYIIDRLYLDEELLKNTPKLKLIQRWGAGFDGVDLKSWGDRNIPVSTCPGVNSGIVAELAIMLMLAVYRNLLPINRMLLNNRFPRTEFFGKSFMIKGKTVGIVGLGNIGSKVAKLVTAFGAEVIYYDIERKTDLEKQYGYKYVSLDTLVTTADIITVHAPLKADTVDLIGKAEFDKMKPLAVLINTARGPIVNEGALVEALETKHILGAGLDTYAHEPLEADCKLIRLENVVACAHAGGNTKDNDINMVKYCYQNIVSFENGGKFNSEKDVVNKEFIKDKKLRERL